MKCCKCGAVLIKDGHGEYYSVIGTQRVYCRKCIQKVVIGK